MFTKTVSFFFVETLAKDFDYGENVVALKVTNSWKACVLSRSKERVSPKFCR